MEKHDIYLSIFQRVFGHPTVMQLKILTFHRI